MGLILPTVKADDPRVLERRLWEDLHILDLETWSGWNDLYRLKIIDYSVPLMKILLAMYGYMRSPICQEAELEEVVVFLGFG